MRHSVQNQTKTRTITLDGQEIIYQLRRSAQARNVRLQIRADSGLAVVVPKNCSQEKTEGILHRRRRWILSTLSRIATLSPCYSKRALEEGDHIPYLGTDRILEIQRTRDCLTEVGITASSIAVRFPGDKDSDVRTIVTDCLRRQAGDLLPQRVQLIAVDKRLAYNRISIRNQRTRWASCSHKRTISLNWRLIMAPPATIDYVVLHELAHLVEMNHSNRFWSIVESWCPDYQRHKQWLRENESLLRLW